MKKYNAEFKLMIVELYKTGSSVKELSREYGVSEFTINRPPALLQQVSTFSRK